MEKLKAHLQSLIDQLENSSEVYDRLQNLIAVYPFNEYEYMISTLLGREKLTLDDYYALRDEYVERNLYLYIFEISAPRGFGEKWAQGHLKELVPELEKPSKKKDPSYSGQYDFWLDHKIKIEVKASRAVDLITGGPDLGNLPVGPFVSWVRELCWLGLSFERTVGLGRHRPA